MAPSHRSLAAAHLERVDVLRAVALGQVRSDGEVAVVGAEWHRHRREVVWQKSTTTNRVEIRRSGSKAGKRAAGMTAHATPPYGSGQKVPSMPSRATGFPFARHARR
eukprot:3825887-Pleurochrysis_carterae.AAC.1